jgi:decaprenylphospho-beta-D-erythro-pentofuranosid-2-ulose 2-reductase
MNALILGGTSDVAIETTKLLLADGWNITLTIRENNKAAALVSKFSTSQDVKTVMFDALKVDDFLAEAKAIAPQFDAVFCFIGYMPDESKEITGKDVQEVMDVNFTALVKVLDIFAAVFVKKGSGTIVGVSSVAGERGKSKNLLYASAKAGLTTYLSGLRNRLFEKKIHVITIVPGFMDTAMTKGLDLPKKLTVSSPQAASIIYSAFKRKKNVAYVSWKWKILMGIIRNIPEWKYKKMKF